MEDKSDNRATTAQPQSSAASPSFEQDSLPWAFGKLAERLATRLLLDAGLRSQYKRWLEKPEEPGRGAGELLELAGGTGWQLMARSTRGELVLAVQQPEFQLVLATVLEERNGRWSGSAKAVCLAHFEGDATFASAWARGLEARIGRPAAASPTELWRSASWWKARVPAVC